MRLKSIVNGNNRQFIRITDVDLLETIEKLLPCKDENNEKYFEGTAGSDSKEDKESTVE